MLTKHLKIEQAFPEKPNKSEYTQFRQQLATKFTGCKIFEPGSLPSETVFEIAMLFGVIDRKYEAIKSKESKGEAQLLTPIRKSKPTIIQKSNSTAQQFQAYMSALTQFVHFFQNPQPLTQSYLQLTYNTVLTLCNKEPASFLWMKKAVEYNLKDIMGFGGIFGEGFWYAEYEDWGRLGKGFMEAQGDGVYMLKMKEHYYYLTKQSQQIQLQLQISQVSNSQLSAQQQPQQTASKIMSKGTMKILESATLPASAVEQIFTKRNNNNNNLQSGYDDLRSSTRSTQQLNRNPNSQQPHSHGPSINLAQLNQPQIPNQSPTKPIENSLSHSSVRNSQIIHQAIPSSRSISEDSILLITQVKCGKCEKSFSEIDCLDWNYMYYCYACLIDINVDTSDIPAPRVNKFMRERNIAPWNYELQCPECTSVTSIPRYNPASKNKYYQCGTCRKLICVQHHGNIYQCYCYCPQCKTPTIHISKISTNICQSCRARYCFKCHKKGYGLCKCVCKQCLGQQSKQHECVPHCHSCSNGPTKLRICRCGLYICYGCYYLALERNKQGGIFPCLEGEYA